MGNYDFDIRLVEESIDRLMLGIWDRVLCTKGIEIVVMIAFVIWCCSDLFVLSVLFKWGRSIFGAVF